MGSAARENIVVAGPSRWRPSWQWRMTQADASPSSSPTQPSLRSSSARVGCVTLQSVRDWVVRFTAQGPAGLINGKAPGRRAILNETQRAALRAIVEQGPIPALHGVVRWRLVDLIAWLWEEFRLSISQQTLSRELRAMNYRKLSARPRHYAKNEHAADVFKKRSPTAWRRSQRRSAASR